MKEPMVADLASRENREITGFFAVGSKQVRTGRDGGRYFALTLADRTGQIEARMWEIDGAGEFDVGDVVKVLGDVSRFNEKLQIKVRKIRRATADEYELGDFVPQSERDLSEMWAELEGWVASFRDPHLKALLEAFLNDGELAGALREAPAACAVADGAVRDGGAALSACRSRSAADGRGAARYREAARAELGDELRVHDGRAAAGAHHDRDRDD
jgi:3'-5' exoribonuclease